MLMIMMATTTLTNKMKRKNLGFLHSIEGSVIHSFINIFINLLECRNDSFVFSLCRKWWELLRHENSVRCMLYTADSLRLRVKDNMMLNHNHRYSSEQHMTLIEKFYKFNGSTCVQHDQWCSQLLRPSPLLAKQTHQVLYTHFIIDAELSIKQQLSKIIQPAIAMRVHSNPSWCDLKPVVFHWRKEALSAYHNILKCLSHLMQWMYCIHQAFFLIAKRKEEMKLHSPRQTTWIMKGKNTRFDVD